MTSIIKWQEPPATNAGRRANKDRVGILDELKKNPGKWALVAESVNGSAVTAWKKLGCEAVGRRNAKDEKKADIYVRWPAPAKGSTTSPATLPPSLQPAERSHLVPAAPAAPKAKPAKASLPISTAAPRLDPNDPKDAALLRQRERYEAARAARLNGGRKA